MNRFSIHTAAMLSLLVIGVDRQAATVLDCQFNTAGDTEGWVDRGIGSGVPGLTADGQSLTAISPGLDPQLKYDGTLERAADAAWDKVTFRIRETETPGGPAIVFDPTGTVVQTNKGLKPQGGITIAEPSAFTLEESGDGFYTVTVSLAAYQLQAIEELRIDPIGGSIKNSNSDTAGNTFEIDFIQVTDTSQAAVSEPE